MAKILNFSISLDELTGSQRRFIDSTAPYLLFCAGVGSGKSTALILKALQLKGLNHALPGLIMAETMGELFTNIIDPMMQHLRAALPAKFVPRIVADAHGRRHMEWIDGCKIHLRSAKAIESFAGLNVAWLCGDEPWLWNPKNYRKACERVRIKSARQLQRCFASTPAMNYLYEEFGTHRRFRETIHASTRENAHNLAPDYIEGMEASYSPRMQRAMIDGDWSVMDGAVYEQFQWTGDSPWLVDFDPKPDLAKCSKVRLAVDPGYRKSAWQWWAERDTPAGKQWVCFDELSPESVSDVACVEMVNARGWPIDEIWCDPAADNTQSLVGVDTLTVLRQIKTRTQHAIRVIDGEFRSIAWGVDKVRVLLGGYERLPRRLLFARRLLEIERGKSRGVLHDIAALRYPEAKDGRPVLDVPLKDGITDHHADATRYMVAGLVMTNPEMRRKDVLLAKMTGAGYRVS